MHELSIAQEIINISAQYLPPDKNISVKAVKLKIGKMSNVFVDSLNFCFELLSENTPLKNAALKIQIVPVVVKCYDCFMENEITDDLIYCPNCNSLNVKIKCGNELDIEELEIEESQE